MKWPAATPNKGVIKVKVDNLLATRKVPEFSPLALNIQPKPYILGPRTTASQEKMGIVSILSTVNAPYSKQLDAQELAHCLLDHHAAKAMPGHMSSFFGEVKPALQMHFASEFNIAESELVAAAKAFAMYSGESYPLAA